MTSFPHPSQVSSVLGVLAALRYVTYGYDDYVELCRGQLFRVPRDIPAGPDVVYCAYASRWSLFFENEEEGTFPL